MSIAKSGPDGYRYQYRASLYVALLCGIDNISEFFIENGSLEDASITYESEKRAIALDIQVKSESNPLNRTKAVERICHFQDRKSNANL